MTYTNEWLKSEIHGIVDSSLHRHHDYIAKIPRYQNYLKQWKRLIPKSVPYMSRTNDLIRASIGIIKNEHYNFNSHNIFDLTGVHPKYLLPF
jgi:hypothetical protein